MFEIKYSNQALRFLKSRDKIIVERILQKIETLQEKPIIHDSKFISGYKEKLYRIRVGDYRILYEVDNKNKIIGIIKMDKRSRVY